MSSRTASQRAVIALLACHLLACRGQLRLEDDGGSDLEDAGQPDTQPAQVDGAPAHVGCMKDGDCALATLHCDVLSGACVACVGDEQCTGPTQHRCDGALHRCVECGVDGDCGMGKVCVPGTRRCASTCHQFTDCVAGGYFCDLSRSICVRCTGDSVCMNFDPDTPFCDLDGQCVTCLNDSVCPMTKPRCDRAIGKCAQCIGTADCSGATPYCDPGTGSCVGP